MEITNDWNYYASYTLTTLPVSALRTVQLLLLTEQSARKCLPQQACVHLFVPSHALLLRGARSGAVCTVAQFGATTSKLPYSHSSHAQLNMHDGM